MTTTGLALLAYGAHLIAPGSGWDLFGGAELGSIDRRFAIRGQNDPPKNIVIVKIDDTTFSELGQRWPFPRSSHARVIRNLKADGAKVIAYDIQFSEFTPKRRGILQDNAFMLFAYPLTGGSFNPARAFGPELVSGSWSDAWIYYVGPLAGGAIAALLYDEVYLRPGPAAVGPPETGVEEPTAGATPRDT